MSSINVAVIGHGYWGPNILRNFLKIPNVKVVAVCDLLKKNLTQVKNEHPQIVTTQDYNYILNNKNIDAVAISTPIATHYQLAKKTLLAKKHVLIEKPITKTTKEANHLIVLAERTNKILMSGHTFVYTEAVKKIKKYIDQKRLGDVYYYDSTRINLGRIQKDANVIWDLATHDMSILSYIIPEKPLSIQVFASSHIKKGLEDMAHIFIKYENNITAHIHVSWLSPVKIRMILIGGRKKMITYNDIEPSEKIKVYHKSIAIPISSITAFSPAYRSGPVKIPHLDQKEAVLTELKHFIYCIKNKKKPLTDAHEGRKVVALLEAADKALKSRSEVHISKLQ